MLGSCTRALDVLVGGLRAPATNASVEIRHEDTGALATLFSDVDGALEITNPFTTVTGSFTVYAEGSSRGYKITATRGAETITERNVPIGTAQYVDEADISVPSVSEFMTDVLAAADAPAAQVLLEVEPGVDVQEHHASLDSLSTITVSAAALTVLDDTTVAAMRATLQIAGENAIPIPATALTPRSANGCAFHATTAGASGQPDIPYLAFDGAAKEYAGFLMRMPKSWNEGTVTAAFGWRRASGTDAANVVWGLRAVAVSDNETPAADFGADATVTDAASTTTANLCLSGKTGACTIGGTPAEGDVVLFEVFRDGASGSDTLNGVDAWLTEVTLYVTLSETSDA